MSVLTWWRDDWPTGRFIETGTGTGDTTRQALRHAEHIDTIEADPDMHGLAVERFRHWPCVQVHLGRSEHVLPGLLRDEPTTVWLDAHWSGGFYGEQHLHPECPVIAELGAIAAFEWSRAPVVLVDDAFMFRGWPWGNYWSSPASYGFSRSEWPRLQAVIEAMPEYDVTMYRHEGVLMFSAS